METGTVIFYDSNRLFGFIRSDELGKDDIFCHKTDILEGRDSSGFLREGDAVEYQVGKDDLGRTRARKIRLISVESEAQ